MLNLQVERFGHTGTLSQELIDFARRQLVNAVMYKGDERRRDQRYPMMLPVLVVPVDEDNQAIGEMFEVISRDVASNSIGLFHTEKISHHRVAIHMLLANTEVNLVIEVTWEGPQGPFRGFGGRYVDKIAKFPVTLPHPVQHEAECL
jgi:hypothetical protein